MPSVLTPLANNVPIVDEHGNPTPYFQRMLQQLLNEKDALQEAVDLTAGIDIIAGVGLAGGGPLDGSGDVTLDLEDTAVTPGVYGDAGNYPIFEVDAQGRLIDASESALPSGGSGGRELIEEKVPDGTATQFTFDSIPGTYKGIELDICVSAGGASAVRFNNNSTGIYQLQRTGHANGAINSQLLAQTQGSLSTLGSINGRMTMLNYAIASIAKVFFGTMAYHTIPPSSGGLAIAPTAITFNDTTNAVTRLDMFFTTAPTNAIGFMRLYGLN